MKDTIQSVLTELELDYSITLISGGQGGRCEIVMWDRPRNSYFSVRCRWVEGDSHRALAHAVKTQLLQRLDALPSTEPFSERSPVSSGSVRVSLRNGAV